MTIIDSKADPPRRDAPEPRENAPRLHSDDLFRGNRRLIIEHAGEDYCLRLTRNERLILTKN